MQPDYDAIVGKMIGNEEGQKLKSALVDAYGANPQYEAELRKVSQETGIPLLAVRNRPDEARRAAYVNGINAEEIAEKYPIFAKFMVQEDNARLAHDDVKNLTALERAVKRMPDEFGSMAGPKPTFSSYTSGIGRSVVSAFDGARQGIRMQFADALGFEEMSQDAQRKAAGAAMRNQMATPDFESSTAQGIYGGINSLAQITPAIAAGIATANPAVSLGIMGAQTQTQAYGKYRLRGADPFMSFVAATGEGAVEVATEMLPMGFLVNRLGKVGAGEFLAGFLARELPSEQVATFVQDAIDTAVANPKTWGEYLAERPDAAYQTALGTLVSSGVLGGLNSAARRLAKNDAAAAQSEQSTALVEKMNELAKASSLVKNSPETFEAFVQKATENGPVTHLYINANALMQSGMAPAVADLSPAIAQQIEAAVATNGVISIPLSEYAARIAPTEQAAALVDHLKDSPDGFSRAEKIEYENNSAQSLKEEVESIMAEKGYENDFLASQDRVRQIVTDELNATGRFSPAVNEAKAMAIAAYHATIASNMGITPEQSFEKALLRVTSERPDGSGFDQGYVEPEGAYVSWELDSQPIFDNEGNEVGSEDYVNIARVFVPPEARGQGHARKMLRKALREIASENPGVPVRLAALPFGDGPQPDMNELVAFYESEGFDVINTEGSSVIMEFDGRIRGDDQQLNQSAEPKDLYVAHNLSAENLLAALDLGGLAAPSIAIARTTTGFDGFGEITLLADPSLLDDKKIRTFDADVYSPRQPRAHYDIDSKAYYALSQSLDPDNLGLSKPDINDVSGTDGAEALLRSDAMRLKFLQEQGKAPALKNQKVDPAVKRAAKLEGDKFALRDNPKFIEIAKAYYQDQLRKVEAADPRRGERYASLYFEQDGSVKYDALRNFADQVARFKQSGGKDVQQLRSDLRDKFNNKKLADEYQNWVSDQFKAMVKGKQLFKGFTNAGNRKYIPYTMDNVVREMTQQLQAGETSFYGAGTVRSAYANELRTLEQIQARREQIISEADFETVKKEADQVFIDAMDKLKPFYKFDADGFGYMEDAGAAIIEGPKGLREAFNVTPEVQQIVADLTEYLRNLPTTYFEAKAQRAVSISEFNTAVVPKGIRKDALQALKDAGLKIKTYDPKVEGDRTRVISQQKELLFQADQDPRGAYLPEDRLIVLLKGANLSTFLHEAGHYFFENHVELAGEILQVSRQFGDEALSDGERKILADVSALLRWNNIDGPIEQQLLTWTNLSFEERRVAHERTAESFERYLFEGKAPSIELQSYFRTFRQWMVSVYKSLKGLLAQRPDAGSLTDEVRAVFDRMLATEEQIEIAKQNRSMLPIVRTREEASNIGMTPEEFMSYQRENEGLLGEALEMLESRGLRDLQWTRNARNREIKKLQREAADLRRQARIDARRQVYTDPVYRAWQFLTGKITPEDKIAQPEKRDPEVLDPSSDSLIAAIAKLGGIKKDEAIAEWGVDPKDAPASGIFGKPVLRATDGLTLDEMRQALIQNGYLDANETDANWNPREFEDKFDAELRGEPQYSNQLDPSNLVEQSPDPSKVSAGRFALDALVEMGLTQEQIEILKARRMTAKVGYLPDDVAMREDIGMASGAELVSKLLAAQPPNEVIDNLTEQIMLQRHSELATPEAIEEEADRAIHSEARAKMVSTEVNALAKAAGKRKILPEMAKQFAEDMVARVRIKDLRPSQYAVAAAKAGKAVQKAMKAGDLATAAQESRNQLVHTYAAKAAYDAREQMRKAQHEWASFSRRGDKGLVKSYDIDIINAVRAILGEYGVAPKQAKKALEYLENVKKYDPASYAIIEASVNAAQANAKPFNELTVEEARGLIDELDMIRRLASRSRKAEIDGDLIDLEEAKETLIARLNELGLPDKLPGTDSAITPGEQRVAKFRTAVASLRRVENWVGQMDGLNPFGPFRRLIWTPVKKAADAYRADKLTYMKKYRELLVQVAPTLKPMTVYSPELNYTFGKDTGGSAMNEILHAILHTGNESNKRKLLIGRGWAVQNEDGALDTSHWDAFINRMVTEGKLQKVHFDFAQGVWDLLESMKPKAQETHRQVFGKYFDEITATPIQTPFGVYAGGYAPAVADARIVTDAKVRKLLEDEHASMAYAFPTTPKGFTKGRVEYNRPLTLDLRTLAQHIDKVLLFSNMEIAVRDTQKIISRISGPLDQYDSGLIEGMLSPWLNRSARQQVTTPISADAGTSRFLNTLRSRAGAAAMFANIANSFQQLTGFSLAAVKVKPKLLLSAATEYIKNPKQMSEAVALASPFMANRMQNEVFAMNDEINEILLNPSLIEKGQAWTMRHAYFMQAAFDNVMSPIVWTGAYNQAIEKGLSHEDSVQLADGAVRETQGSTLAEDVSRVETGNAWVRLFTQFAGYFNMQANLIGTELSKTMQAYGLRKGAGKGLYIFMLGFMAPAVVGELVMQLFRGGPEDEDKDGEYLDDWLAALFFWAPLRNATAMIPYAGQAINSAVNAFNSKPYDDRMASSPAISMLESAVKAPRSVYKAIVDDGSSQKAVRDVATLISITVGLPANVAARPLGYLAGVADGKIDPTGPVDLVRGLLTGVASPASK